MNITAHPDGWCRQPGCDGFVRASVDSAPQSLGAPIGTKTHLRKTGQRASHLDSDEAYDVRVSLRAVESFRFHHGGTGTAAERQLSSMLEDFTLLSVQEETRSGFLRLSRSGYTLILSPDASAITGYVTVHRERTWAQLRAGVPSRFGKRRKFRPLSKEALASYTQGQEIVGSVASVANFGVFVHIGEVHGLLHTSRIGELGGRCLKETFEVGQQLDVVVDQIDEASGRISLRLPSSA